MTTLERHAATEKLRQRGLRPRRSSQPQKGIGTRAPGAKISGPSFLFARRHLLNENVHLGQPVGELGEQIRGAVQAVVQSLFAEALVLENPTTRLTSELTARLSSFSQTLDDLIEELRQRPIVKPALIFDLASTSYTLRYPVQIVVEEFPNEVTAAWPEVEVFGSGDTDSEAILAMKLDLAALWEDLKTSPDEELGAMALNWKRTLERLVISDGSA